MRLRTTNGLERINRELRRHPRGCLPGLGTACRTRRRVDDPQGLSKPQSLTRASCHPPRKFTEKRLHYPCRVLTLWGSGWDITIPREYCEVSKRLRLPVLQEMTGLGIHAHMDFFTLDGEDIECPYCHLLRLVF